jgi:hypothetical protein
MDILMVGALIGFSTYVVEPDDLIFGILFESIVLIAFAVFLGIF